MLPICDSKQDLSGIFRILKRTFPCFPIDFRWSQCYNLVRKNLDMGLCISLPLT